MAEPDQMARRFIVLQAGDPAPWFRQRATSRENYAFDTAAGRYVVMLFLGTAGDAAGRAAMDAVLAQSSQFDDDRVCFFGVSSDPRDQNEGRLFERLPGIRHFWDFDGAVGRLYGALPTDSKPGESALPVRRFWLVLDPTLHVMASFDFNAHDAVFDYVRKLPPPALFAGYEVSAPVIVLPNVFEPALCQKLIRLYQASGGEKSGFMHEEDGKTLTKHDAGHKVRRDYTVEDQDLIQFIQRRIKGRIVPEVAKVHQFHATRMERYLVACYSAEDGGHFQAHRDNTTKGTAHRRFAVSINLNDTFEGGELSFPEYGPRSHKMPAGTAVVFSCSLLHRVSKVTRGQRYAFLPFLYDEAAAKIRVANNEHLGEGVAKYQG
jgi:predicted 2-oxoglutarate/Fe(II)-dependent dioxygenase YbiX/peroxiredoxin